jgi:integrase
MGKTNMKLHSDKYKSGEKALTKKEYEKLISVIDNIGDELLIKMAVTTGLRREDLCSIKVKNINLTDGILTFHESKKNLDRSIYLNKDVMLLIKKYMNTQNDREMLFDFVGRTAYRHLNMWCVVAGIPERPFHALRATCVKFCQAAGWTPSEVSKLTGYTIRVIEEHYATPSDGEMKNAIQEKAII